MFDRYLKTVVGGEYLSTEEAYNTARMLLHDNIPDVKAAVLLSAIRTRKESVNELSGFVQAIYEQAITIESDAELIDTCGTGGDGLGTFNISTAAALVVASCGVPVAKHGNRAVTGKVGSADVLEGLGVNIQLNPDEARELLDKVGITFLFAPYYHPILKQVGGLRREIGVATIFNFLGPLLNPCKLSYQVMGIADHNLLEAIALTMINLGRKRALVVYGENGMDEISPFCSTIVHQVENNELTISDINPAELGIAPCSMDDIKGGDIFTNTRIITEVLAGNNGPHRDAVVLNASAALMTAGRVRDMQSGLQMACEAIDSGKARTTLASMVSYSRDRVLVC